MGEKPIEYLMANERLFNKILVANRSEIAVRVMKACHTLGIPCVAVYSEADKNSRHRWEADESVFIGPPPPRESYLDIQKILDAAHATGCDAIHPGYGFLAENPLFPKACAEAGLTFIGPTSEAMRLLGNKVESRVSMAKVGVPLIPGMTGSATEFAEFKKAADKAGYPILIKAAAGGGGKGMRVVHEESGLQAALDGARREAANAFGDDTVYLEKYLEQPRHIEFQVLADHHGTCIHLFERECSIQRRHQKIIEETPSVALTPDLREKMGKAAVQVAQTSGYTNAGTVEFLLDQKGNFYFLEMNTRIQVEHPVTEMVTGVDLVVEQIKVAAGLPLSEEVKSRVQRGHAIECRLYAEDGENEFMPAIGTVHYYEEPAGPGIRVDSGIWQGSEITINYDPIMAKLIVHAPNRELAIRKMIQALRAYKVLGVRTSKQFMIEVLAHPAFIAGHTFTNFIPEHMQGRQEQLPSVRPFAAIAAAFARSNSTAVATGTGEQVVEVTPWQSLGRWEIGGSIGG